MSLFYISSFVTYIKITTKLQKLYNPPRNLRAGKKSPALFLKKPLCTGDLLPTHKIFIERPKKPPWFYLLNFLHQHKTRALFVNTEYQYWSIAFLQMTYNSFHTCFLKKVSKIFMKNFFLTFFLQAKLHLKSTILFSGGFLCCNFIISWNWYW